MSISSTYAIRIILINFKILIWVLNNLVHRITGELIGITKGITKGK